MQFIVFRSEPCGITDIMCSPPMKILTLSTSVSINPSVIARYFIILTSHPFYHAHVLERNHYCFVFKYAATIRFVMSIAAFLYFTVTPLLSLTTTSPILYTSFFKTATFSPSLSSTVHVTTSPTSRPNSRIMKAGTTSRRPHATTFVFIIYLTSI